MQVRIWKVVLLAVTPTEYTPSHENTQKTTKATLRAKHMREIKYTAGFSVMKRAAHSNSLRPVSIQDQKQQSINACTNPITMKEMANPNELMMNPSITNASSTAKLNPIRKNIVCLGYSFPSTTMMTERAHERAIMPTIGPTTLAITYPKPAIAELDSVEVTIVAIRSFPEQIKNAPPPNVAPNITTNATRQHHSVHDRDSTGPDLQSCDVVLKCQLYFSMSSQAISKIFINGTQAYFHFPFIQAQQNQLNNLTQFVIEDYNMSASIASDKENYTSNQSRSLMCPTHQGKAFKIQLGLNNGPFLSKDVMFSNQKSTYLIAAKQILESHKSMALMMTALNAEQESQSKSVRNSSKVESWFSKCQFIEEELKYMQGQLKKLTAEESRLRVQVKISFANLIRENQDLAQSFGPLLKNLLKRIRDQNSEQKHLLEEKKRDINELNQFRNTYLDQLVNCQRRIIKVQEFLGIAETSNTL